MKKVIAIAAGVAFATSAAIPAFAQETPQNADASRPDPTPVSDADGEVALRSTDIVVTGKRGKMVSSGGLGARSILDTPFSVTALTSQEITERGLSSIDEILKGDSGARAASNGVTAIYSQVTVRGLLLDVFNSYKIDGLSFPTRTNLPIEHFQQVELLKGLSGFMYGFGTPGGIVNYITKRPTDTPQLTLGAGFASDGIWKGSVDVGGRFGPNDAIGLRIVGVHEQGATYIDGGHLKRDSISASLSIKLNNTFTLLADGLYQDRRTDRVIYAIFLPGPQPGAPLVPVPQPIDGRNNLSETGSFYNDKAQVGTVGLDINIASGWKANISYRHADMSDWFREGGVDLMNAAGDYSLTEYNARQVYRSNQVQALVIGKFDTGILTHDVSFGASWQRFDNFEDYQGSLPGSFNGQTPISGIGNIYRPRTLVGGTIDAYAHSIYKSYFISQKAIFASDTIGWKNISLLIGARLNKFEQVSYLNTGSQDKSYDTTPLTPTIALRYKPDSETTFYVSYVQALERGSIADITTKNFGETFGPKRSNQYEIGFKTDRRVWSGSAAAFRIEQDIGYLTSANIFVQDGRARYQGIEASATVRPTSTLSVTAQGMYLDTRFVKAAAGVVGSRVPGAARYQGSLLAQYRPISDLKFIGGLTYVGPSKFEPTTDRMVPGYTTIDGSATYTVHVPTPVTLNISVKNLTNKKYWTVLAADFSAIQAAPPRTVVASASVSF